MHARILGPAVLLVLFVGAGCTKSPPPASPPAGKSPTWQVLDEANLSEAQVAQRDRALAARDALMGSLKSRLMDVFSNDGPAAAISVCKEDAPRLAKEVSEQHDLSIGRTSFRLRNSENKAPDWAEALVADKIAEPTYLASDDRLAALLPITTGPLCLTCHGTKDGMPDEILATLSKEYPDDQATGFEEGDLRGWFWVEVTGP